MFVTQSPSAGMRMSGIALSLLVAIVLAACTSNHAYETAFSSKTALANNNHTFSAPATQVFDATKLALVRQGFEIEEVNAAEGLLKGIRTFDDPKNSQIAYLVTVTADVTATTPATTVLTAAASQKTVLNREVHKYYHLLGLVPIPTGRDYQSVVRAEGDITGASFYQDFFAAVSKNLALQGADSSTAQTPAKGPTPLQPVAPAHPPGSAAAASTASSQMPK